MSRGYAALGVLGAGLCGVLITYTTFQPELEAQKAERTGEFQEKHPSRDKVISEAIASDLNEAKAQVMDTTGGFAWGIRQAIFGKPGQQPSKEQPHAVAKNETAPIQEKVDK